MVNNMAAPYKTPGVYVEEIPKFPPSIAAVETAIPAFIGYTEKAERNGESLTNKPTRIESIAEYVQLFGGPPPQKVTLYLDGDNQFKRAEADAKLYLYDSLRLFYANGGGNCYIVSAGDYPTGTPDYDFDKALDQLAIEDEPTIILAPDAVSKGTGPYDFQIKALTQCKDLMDRVTICDLTKSDSKDDFHNSVSTFRDKVGINYLKYGAAYGPWINSNLPRFVYHRDLTIKRSDVDGDKVFLDKLTADRDILFILNDIIAAEQAVTSLKTKEYESAKTAFGDKGANKKWQDILKSKSDAYNALLPQGDIKTYETALQGIYDLLATILADVKSMVDELPTIDDSIKEPDKQKTKTFKLKTYIDQYKDGFGLKNVFAVLAAHYNFLRNDDNDGVKIFSDAVDSDLVKGIPLLGYATLTDFQAISDSIIEQAYTKVGLGAVVATTANKKAVDAKGKATKAKTDAGLLNAGSTANSIKDAAGSVATAATDVIGAADGVIGATEDSTVKIDANKAKSDANKAKSDAESAANTVPPDLAKIKTAADDVENAAKVVVAAAGTVKAAADVTVAKPKADLAKNAAMKASDSIIALYRFAQDSAAESEKTFNGALLNSFGTYKNIVSKAAEALNLLPPSGAIAGVYAAVDRDRGVWKAPANVSLNAVISPAVKISHEQQAEYNIDVNAGKSINIIRSFTGKGTLVWGARTLAGNDNEWRYVSVRRFFNFVEESVKKATEQFVFEPNDANTWVRIQAMIENFLTTLWRQGALQGVKPEHAFYVAVGLGKTMTPLDILEGRMIIEIGMAAVRPAEFIILKFSHKMAES